MAEYNNQIAMAVASKLKDEAKINDTQYSAIVNDILDGVAFPHALAKHGIEDGKVKYDQELINIQNLHFAKVKEYDEKQIQKSKLEDSKVEVKLLHEENESRYKDKLKHSEKFPENPRLKTLAESAEKEYKHTTKRLAAIDNTLAGLETDLTELKAQLGF